MEDKYYLQNLFFDMLGRPQQENYVHVTYAIYGGDKTGGRVETIAVASLTHAVKNPGDKVQVFEAKYVMPVIHGFVRKIPTHMQDRFALDDEKGTLVYTEKGES